MVISGALAVDPSCNSTDEKNTELQLYADAVKGDPIGKSRSLVTAFRSSGQRRADFRQTIRDGNMDGTWRLPLVQLLRDVDTRWSAIELMIGRILDLTQVHMTACLFFVFVLIQVFATLGY